MKDLLLKEIVLCLTPYEYLFLIISFLIPSCGLPAETVVLYAGLATLRIFTNAYANKDFSYSLMLPITKKQMIKVRCLLIFLFEMALLLLSIMFSFLYKFFIKNTNFVGISSNLMLFSAILIEFTAFHMIFFIKFYKKAEKPGLPFLLASIGFWAVSMLLETPFIKLGFEINNANLFTLLNSNSKDALIFQLPFVIGSIALYVVGWIFTYKISSKRFQKVNL